MAGSYVRCLTCGWEGPRSEVDKVNLGIEDGGEHDQCPVINCGSLDLDVYSESGIEMQRRIEAVEAGEVF